MRGRTIAAVGAGAAVTVAATAVLTTGMLGSSVPIVGTQRAAASELIPFDDCEQLLEWYVDAALPRVGPYGLDHGWYTELDTGVRTAAPRDATDQAEGSSSDAVGNGATGTNVQEAGVDEPDVAKTDGSVVAQVTGRQLTLTGTDGGTPRRLSRLEVPEGLADAELLWVGDRLLLLAGDSGGWDGPLPRDLVADRIAPPQDARGTTTALVVDVADPARPRIEQETTFGGRLLSARQYDDVVRLVVSTSRPTIDFVTPDGSRTPQQATRENRSLLQKSTIDDWLPTVGTGDDTTRLVDCADVQHPEESSGFGTVTVVGFRPDDPAARRTTAITTSSDLVYSSADRLYLATAPGRDWGVPMPLDTGDTGATVAPGLPEPPKRPKAPVTELHAFRLDGTDAVYTASGSVPGRVRDRWSLSEYDGHLRVATALGRDSWSPRENAVVVLEERGAVLTEVGRIAEMGIGEQIQSVRWFDDLAIVVTFRQVDPLYTVDLSDPTAPRVAGELKIPGFSSYLHPLGDDLLLGLGQDADLQGLSLGGQAAVFDVSDLAAPTRVDTEAFGPAAHFVAAWEPRGFTYLPEQRLVLAPIQDQLRGATRLAVLEVGENGSLVRRSNRAVPGWDATSVRALPLTDGTVAVVAAGEVTLLDPAAP